LRRLWLRRLERRHRLRRRLRGLLAMDGLGLDPYLLAGTERKAGTTKVLQRTRRGIQFALRTHAHQH
jgi:hypothetical protein